MFTFVVNSNQHIIVAKHIKCIKMFNYEFIPKLHIKLDIVNVAVT